MNDGDLDNLSKLIERLREMSLRAGEVLLGDLRESEMAEGDGADRLSRLGRERLSLGEVQQLTGDVGRLVERPLVRVSQQLAEHEDRTGGRAHLLRPQLHRPVEPPGPAARLAVDEVDARHNGGELGGRVDVVFRDPAEHVAAERAVRPGDQLEPAVDKAHRQQLEIAGRQRVMDRLHRRVVLEVPPGRPAVQLGNLVAHLVPQLRPQELGEEMLVAVPRRVRVEPIDEEVLRDDSLGDVSAVGSIRHRIGEIGREAFGDRRGEQEVSDVVRLTPQHLGEQVFGRGSLVEPDDGIHRRAVPLAGAVGEREQTHSCRPPFGLLEQHGEGRVVELDAEAVQQHARLAGREGEILSPKLRELAARTQEMQREDGIVSC